ncbi:ferritin-like domain-containing protein [Panacibacter sp. DH6]|uniref:Ferritin-like domain-containing protein n=1 Tax=Panacibacter microcysteis TaxID=2793269 RepID=A0A931GZD0_9BACT|nr:ferritin-like domain-containing protein [Panacibacter microcysteis]MBG9378132.1 ferritin-like domain-containing protein [Panacibacter microcysteis]
MSTTIKWINHFSANALRQRIDWNLKPAINNKEMREILPSLQAWQLGETSDGRHLIFAATKYAWRISDPAYIEAVKLFIKEEQKHGNNLGRYLDLIQQPRIQKNWGDTLFRKIRYFNTNMELWTLTVITVESTAQVFYQCLKDATGCRLLKQICTDILIDEAYHIDFQLERLYILFSNKSFVQRLIVEKMYFMFFYTTILVVWCAHKKLFMAGGVTFSKYLRKMIFKYRKTISRITAVQRGMKEKFNKAYGVSS